MDKRRLGALAALAAGLLLVFAALGVAGAPAAASNNSCDTQGFWSGSFAGSLPGDQGGVTFQISNGESLDLSDPFEKDSKYKFTWSTVFVSNGATASGTGRVDVTSPTAALFSISGQGTHPLIGSFSLDASGSLTCGAGFGIDAMGMFHLAFANGMTDDGTVSLFHGGD